MSIKPICKCVDQEAMIAGFDVVYFRSQRQGVNEDASGARVTDAATGEYEEETLFSRYKNWKEAEDRLLRRLAVCRCGEHTTRDGRPTTMIPTPAGFTEFMEAGMHEFHRKVLAKIKESATTLPEYSKQMERHLVEAETPEDALTRMEQFFAWYGSPVVFLLLGSDGECTSRAVGCVG